MDNTDIIERLAKVELKVENAINEIHVNKELAISVKEIATELKYMREEQNKMNEEQNKMNDRLKKIEDKPIKDYEDTKAQIKKMIVAFFGGIILTALGFALGLNKFM